MVYLVIFSFIKKFSTDRSIQVRVGSTLSETYVLDNGTAQGSIISPLLFLIMINDLTDELRDVESSLFADDSCVFKLGKNLTHITRSVQDNLNSHCGVICGDLRYHSLDKTVAVVFSHRKDTDIKLSINNRSVKIDNKAKLLGLIFDSKLN